MSTLSELLRNAVKAIIDFVQSSYRHLTYRQEDEIKQYMNGQPDKDEAADTVLNASLPLLKAGECELVRGELSGIVQEMEKEYR